MLVTCARGFTICPKIERIAHFTAQLFFCRVVPLTVGIRLALALPCESIALTIDEDTVAVRLRAALAAGRIVPVIEAGALPQLGVPIVTDTVAVAHTEVRGSVQQAGTRNAAVLARPVLKTGALEEGRIAYSIHTFSEARGAEIAVLAARARFPTPVPAIIFIAGADAVR